MSARADIGKAASVSVLDPAFIESLCSAAQLSAKEREVMLLDCSGSYTAEDLAAKTGSSVACVRTYRSRAKRKIRDAQARYDAEQRGRDQEEQDAEDLAESRGFYGFVLREAMAGPKNPNPVSVPVGLTWTDHTGVTLSQEGGMGAGSKAVVTVEDLTGRSHGVGSAWEERVKPHARKFSVHGKQRNG